MTYAVREIFDTLQGEGLRAGTRAIFVRLTGCNMWTGNPEHRSAGAGACALWCDTDFMPRRGTKKTAVEIANECEVLWPEQQGDTNRWIVLTGGEPYLQADDTLVNTLHDYGFKVAVETNGTVWPRLSVTSFDHVCVSPKLKADGSFPDLQVWKAHELKVVLPGIVDGVGWTDAMLQELATLGEWGQKFVQPMDPTDPKVVEVSHLRGGYFKPKQLEAALDRCLQWVKAHPDWRFGVQLHKVLNLP